MGAVILRGEVAHELSGDGYGDGYGAGAGYGAGDGAGDGYGYGDGSGSGDGSGDGSYWSKTIKYFSARWSATQRARLAELEKLGAKIAFWRSGDDGRACNGGSNNPVAPGVVETSPGPLSLCERGTLHATLIPPKWKGSRWWIVALIGEVVGDDEKYGALTREIIGEAL